MHVAFRLSDAQVKLLLDEATRWPDLSLNLVAKRILIEVLTNQRDFAYVKAVLDAMHEDVDISRRKIGSLQDEFHRFVEAFKKWSAQQVS